MMDMKLPDYLDLLIEVIKSDDFSGFCYKTRQNSITVQSAEKDMSAWEFVGLDGKNCIFANEGIHSFVAPTETETEFEGVKVKIQNAVFSGQGRTVMVWRDSANKVVNADVYEGDFRDGEDILKMSKSKPIFNYDKPGDWPSSNDLIEIGKFFIYAELPAKELEGPVEGFVLDESEES